LSRIEKIIEELNAYINELSKEHDRELAELTRKLVIIEKYKDKKPKSEEELKELLSLLCYDNLVYCCGLKKPCYWRDTVLAILRISNKKYKEWKEGMWKEFVKTYL